MLMWHNHPTTKGAPMKHLLHACMAIGIILSLCGCPAEEPEGPCEVDCASLEYCGQPACEVCPSLCNEPNPSSSTDAGTTPQSPSSDAGQQDSPITDAGTSASVPAEDAGSTTEPEPPTPNDAGPPNQAFNCDAINNIQKSWGGTTGPCGPHDVVTINSDGTVTISEEDAYPPDGAVECAAPALSQYTVSAETATDLVALVCTDYKTNHDPNTDGCVGAYENFRLRQDDTIVATADISCGNTSMSASEIAFIDFMAALAPSSNDAGTIAPDPVEDAGSSDVIDCTQVNFIKKVSGGSSGPCGPHTSITVSLNGTVEKSVEDAYPPQGESECASPVITNYNTAGSDALALITSVCNDYNANYVASAQSCVGAYQWFGLYDDDAELGKAVLSCGNSSMNPSQEAFDAFMNALESTNATADAGQ